MKPRNPLLTRAVFLPALALLVGPLTAQQRGDIATGAYADITIFHPNSITDRATSLQPAQHSEGVRYALPRRPSVWHPSHRYCELPLWSDPSQAAKV